ncbi:MAG: 16S rRNA (cytosine(1402)-N(4))-methyltransferase RsmH [Humidesulfovibrio sp.]|uniref:16S rRNA (cytosine(1402)-N(4))-methyltransferase RsmH n=1 Tax=Humidesulfovibrio sp. TaxID=2910988 RepID=UPI0027323347|nr:16S rRNA (cytosine(1402)-N(4))-methyltransferase RsmH [Humidesulfovibrio sp.]MDP2847459.1 16S rRNA (cytosine(1402)-N(4))-methyltransferase RsmH [Humidesulfovibrio sp.]
MPANEKVPHIPVMLDEIVGYLSPRPGGRYLDGTLGLAGHSLGLLRASGGQAELLCLDRDEQALALARERLKEFPGRANTFYSPFSEFEEALEELGWDGLDGAVLDLGVSSLQLDEAERGFSFNVDGPLDMRMDATSDMDSAKVLVNREHYEELRRIIRDLGDEPLGGKIARAIIRAREQAEITTTSRLAEIVSRAYPPDRRREARNHPATRTFMALRMAVNHEVEELKTFLERIVHHLKPGGRVAIISFHSAEDREVKESFRYWAKGCRCPLEQAFCTCDRLPVLKVLTKKPQLPTQLEVDRNPRSRSAKLRVAERLPIPEVAT